MQTVTLAQESEEMEEKLQLLKERMSKEKEERGWVAVLQNQVKGGVERCRDRVERLDIGKQHE